ncbi:MAG: hypothetical protein IIB63_00585 [Proteobacteria bacterium]|nr:hypothetical protein [Pseudomonadota bacterium]
MRTRVDERAWKDFAAWCTARGLRPMPAHPWTVAAYARWCEPRQGYRTIVKRIKAIARAHLLNCLRPPDRHPTVRRTLRMIETRARHKGGRAALFRAEDFVGPAGAPAASSASSQPSPPSPGVTARRRRSLRSSPRLVSRRPPRRPPAGGASS